MIFSFIFQNLIVTLIKNVYFNYLYYVILIIYIDINSKKRIYTFLYKF